jgi:hypothetical protein
MLAFTLSMPGVGSWNGRWSGEERIHVRLVPVRAGAKSRARADELLAERYWRYDFGDGWAAGVSVREVDGPEARQLQRRSAGFCGYDWMVDEIMEHGRILRLDERVTPA